ncbi:MAG: response regulator, partial [Vicinamibacterales bacterium]|nr:response regulator [Vicinamibacterales bacterium]
EVTTVDSGRAALEQLECETWDMVILDWRMPDLDGIETARRIRSRLSTVRLPKILMVTAYGREEVMKQADELGLDGLLIKPISESILFDTIMEAFGRDRGRVPDEANASARFTDASTPLMGAHVLVVEDNAINQQVAEEILAGYGLTVEIAANGRIATEMLGASPNRYDAVLMDLQMPEMDGYDATQFIRTRLKNQTTPIIAMSAHALTHERQRALDIGMNDYVTKPVDPDQLLATLTRWIAPRPGQPPAAPVRSRPSETSGDLPDSLPGIHVRSALARMMGNQVLLRTLLADFRAHHTAAAAEIQRAIECDKPTEARRLAHTIQGVAGNLSMVDVFASARTTEALIQIGDLARLPAALAGLHDAIQAVMPSVATLLETGPVPVPPAAVENQSALDPARVGPLVVELDRSLKRNSLTARKQCGVLARELRGAGGDVPQAVTRLEASLARLDFRQARADLASIAAVLDITLV